MYMIEHAAVSNWWLSWLDDPSGLGSPRRIIRTSAESLAVKRAAGIPLPTTSPTAIAQRLAVPSSSLPVRG